MRFTFFFEGLYMLHVQNSRHRSCVCIQQWCSPWTCYCKLYLTAPCVWWKCIVPCWSHFFLSGFAV